MRRFTLLLITCFATLQQANAQVELIGSHEYGRMFDLTYDYKIENRIYALTGGNHITVSNDNGKTWDILYSHQDGDIQGLKYNQSSNTLSFFSRNSMQAQDALFVYSLETGKLVKEFILPIQPADGQWISAYDLYDQDTNRAIVIQGFKIGFDNYSKVQYTTDGGNSWKEVYFTVENNNIFPTRVAIAHDNPNKLFITLGNGNSGISGGLLISEDNSETWEDKLPNVALGPITINPVNANEIYVGTTITFGQQPENLYKSIDGGNTWNIVPIAWNDYLLNDIVSININPHHPQDVFVFEENEVIRSADGGNTWDKFIYENAADNVEDYYYGTNSSFNPFNENELVVTANYYPLFSSNKGTAFTRIKSPYFFTSGSIQLVKNETEQHLYFGLQSGYLHIDLSTNQDTEYNVLPLNYSSLGGVGVIADKEKVGKVFQFSGGFMGRDLAVSTDHGLNTSNIYNTFKTTLDGIKSVDDNKVLVGVSSLGLESELVLIDYTDLQNVQTTAIIPPKMDGSIRNIFIDEVNNQQLLISQQEGLYKSLDFGTTWTALTNGLEDFSESDLIFKVVKNPLNKDQYTFTSNLGIFTSLDKGENWQKINDELFFNVVHSPLNPQQLVAISHDSNLSQFRIVFSGDSGKTWKEVNREELFNLKTSNTFTSSDFNFIENAVEIFVATADLGIVKYTLDLKTLGLSDPEIITSKSTIIYPNPVVDYLNIKLSDKQQLNSLEIYNLNGNKVFTSNKNNVDISALIKGIYLVKIKLSNGKVETHKLIKK